MPVLRENLRRGLKLMRAQWDWMAGAGVAALSASVWKRDGWEAKLVAAATGIQLVGPLMHPYEPWHWRLTR